MVNRVIVAGRLTRDPEVRTTSTGKSVAGFSVAVDRKYKTEAQTADFFNVTAWGSTAEFVGKYCQKGRLVLVEGRLQARKYTDKSGIDRNIVEIVADSVDPLDRPRDAQPSGSVGEESTSIADASFTPNDNLDDYDPFSDE